MDKLIYTAMTGAKNNTLAQAVHANNLANMMTTGFRADFTQARSMQAFGDSFPSRVFSASEIPGTDFSQGGLKETARSLDVAIEGQGFIAVDGADGNEAFTRAGDLFVDEVGFLRTGTGISVLGDGGPIVVPPFEKIELARDGTISIRGQGQGPETLNQVGRIKLVNPDLEGVRKGADGLFRRIDGLIEPAAAEVKLSSGFLENSNVNAIEAMTSMLTLSRQFEVQVKMIKTAEDNDEAATRLLQVN